LKGPANEPDLVRELAIFLDMVQDDLVIGLDIGVHIVHFREQDLE
jgi:hypothetical protein